MQIEIRKIEKGYRCYNGRRNLFFKKRMKIKDKIIFISICMILMITGCTYVAEDSYVEISDVNKKEEINEEAEANVDIPNEEIEEIEDVVSNEHVYEQNDAYKLFYGTWEVTSIVSEHVRLGGDEGCEDILGMRITYLPDKYEFGGIVSIENPNYLMSIFPTDSPFLNMQEQVSMKTLMPDSDYFVWVQIVDKPTSSEAVTGMDFGLEVYVGNEFFIKDDNTLYCFDYNCIYELKRVNYLDDYDPQSTPAYQERW